jgi:hypothetical protein
MAFLFFNRTLRAMLAGAVIITGTACSRSDRTESGSDTSAAALPDTSYNTPQPSGADTATGATSDTAAAPGQSSNSPQPGSAAPSNSPRAETAPPNDGDAAGYRPMERDTSNVPSDPVDSARVTADTAEAPAASSDTTVSGIPETTDTTAIEESAVEMARDTSTVTDQAAETSVASAADSAYPADSAVTTDNAGPIRPPEDSTEILGSLTTTDEAADETADEQIVTPEDGETVAASETPTDEVGAAAVAGGLTGAEAVALVSREGVRCAVVDPEVNEAVRWDMSSTPVTLNPCGMGSMVLSRIWTEK